MRKYDYELIVELYKQGMTTREIAGKIGGHSSRVGDIIKNAGVSRTKNTRQSVLNARAKLCPELDKLFLDYFDGLMISDGGLTRPSKHTATSCYTHTSVCEEWLRKISATFLDNGIISSLSPTKRPRQFCLRSYRYDKLYDQYNRWYPNGGEKRVPSDIDITSKLMLKNWVYGDGTICHDFRLCTDCFPIQDTEFLIAKLGKLGFGFRTVYMGKAKSGIDKFRLSICKRTGLIEFFEYIGDPEIVGLSYKWPRRADKCTSSEWLGSVKTAKTF